MNDKKRDLKHSVIHGFRTLFIREVSLKLFSFVGQIFLARLLAPADFGIYVILVFIISLISLFSDIGLSFAIIQKKTAPTSQELSGVFWLKVLLSLTLIILIWILAPSAKLFYPAFTDTNVAMLRIFSITLLLTGLRTIPIALLERKIKYNVISLLDIVGVLVYYLVALGGALMHFGVWSFIVGAIVKELIETVVLYFVQPFTPQIMSFKHNIKKMVRFGIYVQGNSLVMFLIPSITPVIGGRLSGPYAVGLLDFANSLAYIPGIISANFARVAFAGYSRIQGQSELLAKAVYKSVSLLTIVIYLFPVIMFSFGGELVKLIYTEKWSPAIPSLYWYSMAVLFYPIVTCFGQIILVFGKSKELFFLTLVTTIFGWVISYLLASTFGFTGIAVASFFIYFALCLSYILILKKSNFKILPFIYTTIPKVFAGICTIIFSLFSSILLPQTIIFLVLKLVLSVGVYIFFMFLFARNDTKELFILALSLLKNKKL